MNTALVGRRALVTDAHTTGALAVVRSLAAAGMSVTVIREADRFSLAAASRFTSRVLALPPPELQPALYLEGLAREIRGGSHDVLIPMTDSTIAILQRERSSIERAVRVALPPDDVLLGSQDKKLTVEKAEANGVRVPRTSVFSSLHDVSIAADSLSYPCVVKPRFSRRWDGQGTITRGAVKYAHSPESLREVYARSQLAPVDLLVQEFVHGAGIGVFALMHEGQPVVVFAHRRLREANPTGGRASLAMSIPADERLVAPALRLLGALRWTGVAMVEFKDPGAPDAPAVMEVNGRFWGSLPLAIASGVDFPVLLVRQVLGLAVVAPGGYSVGVRCRHLTGDLSHLAAAVKGRPRGWTGPFPGRVEALASIAPWPGRWRSFTLQLADPAPALGEAADCLRGTVKGLLRRSESRTMKGVVEQP